MRDELEALRARVAALDARLVDLVGERLAAAGRIGRLKASRGLPLRDPGVEARVVARFEARCRALGIEEGVGRRLAELLIGSALTVQAPGEGIPPGAAGRAVVLGGGGRMGSWLSTFLRGRGYAVTVVDPRGAPEGLPRAEDPGAVVGDARLVLLATPLEGSARLLAQVVDAGPEGVVADICSVKAPLLPEIRRGIGAGLRIGSLHPMFSPASGGPQGRNLLLCRCGSPEADGFLRALFAAAGANVVELDVEEHDGLMAYVLGLGHAVNIAFAAALAASGRGRGKLEAVAGPTFARQAALAREVVGEDPDLYFAIEALNPHARRAAEAFAAAFGEVEGAAAGGRREAFAALMARGRRFFGGG